jgi:hypothetical protein
MSNQNILDHITQSVEKAFNKHFKEKSMDNITQTQTNNTQDNTQSKAVYQSIQEYTAATGKRFRMTKEQTQRNISREEAFREFIKTLS